MPISAPKKVADRDGAFVRQLEAWSDEQFPGQPFPHEHGVGMSQGLEDPQSVGPDMARRVRVAHGVVGFAEFGEGWTRASRSHAEN
jgi:hypothetical protein